jgi:hypothetical protein
METVVLWKNGNTLYMNNIFMYKEIHNPLL